MYLQLENDPFFAIVRRDRAMVFMKSDENLLPKLNTSSDPEMKWDAYLYVTRLAAEFMDNKVNFRKPLMVTSEKLWGFEVSDPDGYVLFFGRPKD